MSLGSIHTDVSVCYAGHKYSRRGSHPYTEASSICKYRNVRNLWERVLFGSNGAQSFRERFVKDSEMFK